MHTHKELCSSVCKNVKLSMVSRCSEQNTDDLFQPLLGHMFDLSESEQHVLVVTFSDSNIFDFHKTQH